VQGLNWQDCTILVAKEGHFDLIPPQKQTKQQQHEKPGITASVA